MTLEDHLKRLEVLSRSDPTKIERTDILDFLGESSWKVRMLLCRLISRIEWYDSELVLVTDFVLQQCQDENTFVRAWALDALASLAVKAPAIEPFVRTLVIEALEHGPPSIRVRARQAMRRLMSEK